MDNIETETIRRERYSMDSHLFAKKIRLYTLKELKNLGFGHIGGSLSIVEVLSVLFHEKIRLKEQKEKNRDMFILSKGHAGPAYYATLFLKGCFSEEFLYSLNTNGTKLPSHPDCNLTPMVDMTTGSLGQGISVAAGVAYKYKTENIDANVYCILGDGEMNEGQIYEALQFISHHKLNNLILFIDDNKKQLDGYTKDICDQLDYVSKMKSFGLYSERVDGHNVVEISKAIDRAKEKDGATVIVLDTIKGKGAPYFEEKLDNHHVRFTKEELEILEQEIKQLEKEIGV